MRIGVPGTTVVLILLINSTFSFGTESKLDLKISIPKEFSNRASNLSSSPDGDTDGSKYKKTFEEFWWNCVMVKAKGLDLSCPFVASGTAAASAGAWNGAVDAENQIKELIREHQSVAVHAYLEKLTTDPKVIDVFAKGRFKGNATPEMQPLTRGTIAKPK